MKNDKNTQTPEVAADHPTLMTELYDHFFPLMEPVGERVEALDSAFAALNQHTDQKGRELLLRLLLSAEDLREQETQRGFLGGFQLAMELMVECCSFDASLWGEQVESA